MARVDSNNLYLNDSESNLVEFENIKTPNPFSHDKNKLKLLITNSPKYTSLFLSLLNSNDSVINIYDYTGECIFSSSKSKLLEVFKGDSNLISQLIPLVSLSTLNDNGNNYKEKIDIKNETLEFDLKEFLQLVSHERTFKEYLIKRLNKPALNYRLKYVEYFKELFNKHKLFDKYHFPLDIKTRIDYLFNNPKFTLDDYDNHISKNHTFVKGIEINPSLRKELDKHLREDFTPTETAIYYYIMLAKTLSFDPEFYAEEQTGLAAKKHEHISRISTITPTNNGCTCYEFNYLFERLLYENNISFKTQKNHKLIYGTEHTHTIFTTDEHSIWADSLKYAMVGDLLRAKVGLPLIGLKSTIPDGNKEKELEQTVNKIYKYINTRTFDKNSIQLSRLVASLNYSDPFRTKLETFLKILKFQSNLGTTEKLGLMKYAYLRYFTDEQLKNNIHFCIIKENKPDDEHISLPLAIFALNKKDVDMIDSNIYFIYDHKGKVIPIKREQLIEKFDDNTYSYLSYSSKRERPGNYSTLVGIPDKKRKP